MAEQMLRRYVAGFLLVNHERQSEPLKKVLLVRKTHPEWQSGMMNAVGGEIELGETPAEAMAREFKEEADLLVQGWEFFCSEDGPGYQVMFYRYHLAAMGLWKPPPANDKGEELEWCDPLNVKYPVIGNLNWLLPLAMDPRPVIATVQTTGDIRKIATW